MKNYHLYIITNKVNGKKYVGITTRGYKARWDAHLKDCFRDSHRCYGTILYNAMRKYGTESFEMTFINEYKSWEELCDEEKILIKNLNTHFKDGYGYNMTYGGDGLFGYKWSKEQLARRPKKRSAAAIAKLKANPNAKITKLGGKNPSAREIVVDGILYTAISTAAKTIGIKNGTLRMRILSKNYPTYQYADNGTPNKNLANKKNNRSRKIQVYDKIYKSVVEAATQLNMSRHVLRKRAVTKKHVDIFYVDK